MNARLSALLSRNPAAPAPRVVRTPTVLQMEALECGVAALAIVLGYHGRHVPIEQLRAQCGTSRDGARVSSLLKAARSHGMTARGCSADIEELKALAGPFIVFWNFNHFVVVEGFAAGKVHINDPARGRRTVSEADFGQAYIGIVLVMRPGPDFVRAGRPGDLLSDVLERMSADRTALGFAAFAGLFMVLPGMVIPVFTTLFIDRILLGAQQTWFLPILLGLLLSVLLETWLAWLQGRHLLRLQDRLWLAWTSRFFWHVLHLPAVFFSQRSPGELASRLGLNETAAQTLTGDLARAIINGGLAFFFVAVMLTYDAMLTALSVGIVLASLAVFQFAARRTQELSMSYAIDTGKLFGTATNGIATLETLRATASDGHFFEKYTALHAQAVTANQRMERVSVFYGQVPALLALFNAALVLCLGGLRVMDGHLTIGMLIAFQGLVVSFSRPLADLFKVLDKVQQLRGDLQRLNDVLRCAPDAETQPREPAGAPQAKLAGRLELRGVGYAHSAFAPLLFRGVSLEARPGERIGVVGPSGCGKSTLARLLMGLNEPAEGEILFDGRPRREHARDVLARSVTMVDQDIHFFDGTIRENLTLWDASVPEADLMQAARDAEIHDFILGRAGGYDSRVDEGGRNMSGGQRQRLEIARALAVKPRLLVLDEATSALDPITEARVLDNLRRRGCTAIVIAHRASTLRQCDTVFVLADAGIVARGTHEALLADAANGYSALLEPW
jgi:NHLM bacteriocin system ABC transporter peptidase/ATP-binding protein